MDQTIEHGAKGLDMCRPTCLLMIGASLAAWATSASAESSKATKNSPAIDPKLTLTAEPIVRLAGGKKGGLYSAQQVQLDVKFDFEKLMSVKGLTGHLTLIKRSGKNASARLLGDNVFQSQEVYGGTRHAAVHLVQAYLQQTLGDGKVDLAAGRLPVGEAFATSPLYCEFMSTGICGYPYGLAVKLGFSAFPNSTWGTRIKYSPSTAMTVLAGAYQVRPREGGKYGFDWGWSGTKGTYLPVELDWHPTFGDDLPGHYKIGGGFDTSTYPDNYEDVNGDPFAVTGLAPRRRKGRYTIYALADQMIHRNGPGERNGLILFAGAAHSRPANSEFSFSAFLGMLDQGIIAGRPDDTAGLAMSFTKVSNRAVRTQELQSGLDKPLLYGAHGVQSHEVVVEARYDFALGSHFHVMPDLQYVIRPGATDAQRNGLLGGMRIKAEF